VGHGGRIQIAAWPRGHGHGRREDDRHDRGVSRITRDVSDAAGGESFGKLDWDWPGGGFVPRGLEERSSETGEPAGARDGEAFAMGDRKAVPVAAGNVSGDWGAGDRVWRTGDCGTVADFEGNCWVEKKVKS